jgi:hypothetical protein
MKRFIFITLLFLGTGCFENQDSNSFDSGGLTVNPSDSAEFVAAKTLFATSCGGGGCHSDYASKTEAQFVAEGLVIPGDLDGSRVFCRLQGSTGPCGGDSKNMPWMQPALAPAELQIISDWIAVVSP